MDYEKEINLLAAETIAIQNVLAHVLFRISEISPALKAAVRRGFDDASSGVEDLRTATLGDHDKPRHGV